MIKYFSMFSGIGGFEYGMEQSNKKFECIGYSEIDKYARSIYEKHYPNHINYGDATKINTKDLPNFELLIGGFPCQAFSIAGKQGGFNDCRGTLFFEIARVLKDKRPKYFLLENVKNLLSHNKGETFKEIIRVFNELRYDVLWEVYNSKDYGVPQNRERIFLKGYFREKCGGEILSQIPSYKKINRKREEVMLSNTEKYLIQTTGRNHQDGRIYSTKKESICLNARGNNGFYIDSENNEKVLVRRLTPIECERLQGFRDNYTKYGADGELISDSQRYKCLGNAVTTTVVENIFNNWSMNI